MSKDKVLWEGDVPFAKQGRFAGLSDPCRVIYRGSTETLDFAVLGVDGTGKKRWVPLHGNYALFIATQAILELSSRDGTKKQPGRKPA